MVTIIFTKRIIVVAEGEKRMNKETENALQELIGRLEQKGFFRKYCRLVCPSYENGGCQDCRLTRRQILELWAQQTDVFDSLGREVYDKPEERS